MLYHIGILLLFAVFNANKAIQKDNPLNGKHLRVLAMEFPPTLIVKRNASGGIQFDGVLIHHIAALSKMFNFSYSYLPYIALVMEDSSPLRRGGMSYLINDEADYFLSTSFPSAQRFKFVDYPISWYEGPLGCILPYPKENINIEASLKPFSFQVWISIVTSVFFIVIFLRLSGIIQLHRRFHSIKDAQGTREIVNFVLGNLVSQGQHFHSNRLALSIAAGAWCCGCFFLVQIYCSTLTSHLTYPNQLPIVNSIYELAHNPSVSFTVDRGLGVDIMLQGIQNGDLKRLADKSNLSNHKFRCNVTADCLKMVREGNAAYCAAVIPLKFIMGNDIKTTGKCNYYMMKDILFNTAAFTALQKNSPYTNAINMGILRLKQSDLLHIWESWYVPSNEKCIEINHVDDKLPRLSIGHLSSAFVILISGYVCSIVVLIFEVVTNWFAQ